MNPDIDKDSDLYSDDFDHFEIQVNINWLFWNTGKYKLNIEIQVNINWILKYR